MGVAWGEGTGGGGTCKQVGVIKRLGCGDCLLSSPPQVKLQASVEESRTLASDLMEAKTLHGEKLSQTLVLQEDISKLQQKLATANRRTVSA